MLHRTLLTLVLISGCGRGPAAQSVVEQPVPVTPPVPPELQQAWDLYPEEQRVGHLNRHRKTLPQMWDGHAADPVASIRLASGIGNAAWVLFDDHKELSRTLSLIAEGPLAVVAASDLPAKMPDGDQMVLGSGYYNIACAKAVAGRRDEAVEDLKRAVRYGYKLFDRMRADPDMAGILTGEGSDAVWAELSEAAATGVEEKADRLMRESPGNVPSLTFRDSEGRTRTLAEFRGRPVSLVFWHGDWNSPHLSGHAKIQEEFGDRVRVIALHPPRMKSPQTPSLLVGVRPDQDEAEAAFTGLNIADGTVVVLDVAGRVAAQESFVSRPEVARAVLRRLLSEK